MHKNPTEARFITASPKFSIKPLTRTINFLGSTEHQTSN